ncbi:MAG: hypothetical protein ACLFT0_07030 [Spirulinaceae cyanobacterium]
MNKPTQAHMSQSWSQNRPDAFKDLKKRQMEYYMGAKLIEVGVDPKSTIMRWSVETKGDRETWTCSTYWGESKNNLLKEEAEE